MQFSGFSVSKSQHTTHYRYTRCGSFFATFFTDLKNHERGEENTLIHKDCGGEYKQNQNLYAKRLFTCRSFFSVYTATYVSVSLLFAAIDRFVDQRRYVRTAVSLQTAYKSRGMRIGEHSLEFYKNEIWKTEKSRFPFFSSTDLHASSSFSSGLMRQNTQSLFALFFRFKMNDCALLKKERRHGKNQQVNTCDFFGCFRASRARAFAIKIIPFIPLLNSV